MQNNWVKTHTNYTLMSIKSFIILVLKNFNSNGFEIIEFSNFQIPYIINHYITKTQPWHINFNSGANALKGTNEITL
jgi:hypothetical protein